MLLRYNRDVGENPLGLLPAADLCEPFAYRELVARFGSENVYILSAGWGLITASFLIPVYDITFSRMKGAGRHKHRHKDDLWDDFNMLPDRSADRVLFLGGKGYIPLFCHLTTMATGLRTVIFNSNSPPDAPGCELQLFATTIRTNWHYKCVRDLLDGKLLPFENSFQAAEGR
jgi:hypothetical protein